MLLYSRAVWVCRLYCVDCRGDVCVCARCTTQGVVCRLYCVDCRADVCVLGALHKEWCVGCACMVPVGEAAQNKHLPFIESR